jgi:hypothetical protein
MYRIDPVIPRQLRLQAVSLLLANDPHLRSEGLDRSKLSDWQRLLLLTAEDILEGRSRVFLQEVICELDEVRFEGLLLALECLRFSRPPEISN